MDLQNLVDKADSIKKEGNQFFKEKQYDTAIKKYLKVQLYTKPILMLYNSQNFNESEEVFNIMFNKALTKIKQPQMSPIQDRALQIQISTFQNLAICFSKLNLFEKQKDYCQKCLALKPTAKAKYLLAQSNLSIFNSEMQVKRKSNLNLLTFAEEQLNEGLDLIDAEIQTDSDTKEKMKEPLKNMQDAVEKLLAKYDRKLVFNRTSIMLNYSHVDDIKFQDCAYCGTKRLIKGFFGEYGDYDEQVVTKMPFYNLGMTSNKMLVSDYSILLDRGFTRIGNYFQIRNQNKCCCEVYQHRVKLQDFKISKSQKKIMKRFHNYLLYGDIKGPASEHQIETKQEGEQADQQKIFEQQARQSILDDYKVKIEANLFGSEVFGDQLNCLKPRIQNCHKVYFNDKIQGLSSNLILLCKADELLKNSIFSQTWLALQSECYHVELAEKQPYINFYPNNNQEIIQMFEKKQDVKKSKPVKVKQKNEENTDFEKQKQEYLQYKNLICEHSNHDKEWLDKKQLPLHKYEISVHLGVYTDEKFDLYEKYEKVVHKKERKREFFKTHLCNSPLYDGNMDSNQPYDKKIAQTPQLNDQSKIDTLRENKEEALNPFPGYGTFHLCHRIDGKLIALSVIDLTEKHLHSAYYLYDPDYNFLTMGVVGAIREIEFMNNLNSKHSQSLWIYQLGEMVLSCDKVNYKNQFRPGMFLCPTYKQDVPFDLSCELKMKAYSHMSIEDKLALGKKIQLLDDDQVSEDVKNNYEFEQKVHQHIKSRWGEAKQVVFNDKTRVSVDSLNPKGIQFVYKFCDLLFAEAGMQIVDNIVFEIKDKPKQKQPQTE